MKVRLIKGKKHYKIKEKRFLFYFTICKTKNKKEAIEYKNFIEKSI